MKKTIAGLVACALALIALSISPASALAEDKGKKKDGGPTILDTMTIEGRVQKPQAFYILQRSNFGFDVMVLITEYADAIKGSVESDVF